MFTDNFEQTRLELLKEMKEKFRTKVYKLKRSKKDGKFIAYSDTGKVILIKNQEDLHEGFARIISYTEKEKYYIATMKNVSYDYFDGISEKELTEVFRINGYTLEYCEPIDDNNSFTVWSNLKTGSLITVETWNYEGVHHFNSINVYITTNDYTFTKFTGKLGFSSGCYDVCCFNIVNSRAEYPLHAVLSLSSNSKYWGNETPTLWHYGYANEDTDITFFANALSKLFYFKNKNLWKEFNMVSIKAYFRMAVNQGYIPPDPSIFPFKIDV